MRWVSSQLPAERASAGVANVKGCCGRYVGPAKPAACREDQCRGDELKGLVGVWGLRSQLPAEGASAGVAKVKVRPVTGG